MAQKRKAEDAATAAAASGGGGGPKVAKPAGAVSALVLAGLDDGRKIKPLADEDNVGEYEISTAEHLGSGEFGDVYTGKHRLTGQKVAVKIFKKTALTNGISLDVLREVS